MKVKFFAKLNKSLNAFDCELRYSKYTSIVIRPQTARFEVQFLDRASPFILPIPTIIPLPLILPLYRGRHAGHEPELAQGALSILASVSVHSPAPAPHPASLKMPTTDGFVLLYGAWKFLH